MSLLVPPRRFDPAIPEIMDRPGQNLTLLSDDLSVLETINRRMGGYAIPLRHLREWVADDFTLLDLATGAADVPRTIVRWARQNHRAACITAVDGNPDILRIARERSME